MCLCYGGCNLKRLKGSCLQQQGNGGVWLGCAWDGRRGCEWTLSRSSTKIEERAPPCQILEMTSKTDNCVFSAQRDRETDDVEMDESTT